MEIRYLFTSTTWWMLSMCLWIFWMILDQISGVEMDSTILFVTGKFSVFEKLLKKRFKCKCVYIFFIVV